MPFWEYKTVPVTLDVEMRRDIASAVGERPTRASIEDVLNEHGEQGWELVTVLALRIDSQMGLHRRHETGASGRKRSAAASLTGVNYYSYVQEPTGER